MKQFKVLLSDINSSWIFFNVFLRKQVLATKAEAERDGVKVPTTLAEYCVRTRAPAPDEGSDLFYDYYYDDDDVEDGDGDCCYDEDDSGNEESWHVFRQRPRSSRHALPHLSIWVGRNSR